MLLFPQKNAPVFPSMDKELPEDIYFHFFHQIFTHSRKFNKKSIVFFRHL